MLNCAATISSSLLSSIGTLTILPDAPSKFLVIERVLLPAHAADRATSMSSIRVDILLFIILLVI